MTTDPRLLERFERLCRVIEGIAQRMRPADEDMLAKGKEELWEALLADQGPEDGYFIIAARNAMVDQIRYQTIRERMQHLSESAIIPTNLVQVDVDDLLALLPLHLRSPFRLHFLQDMTIKETAQKLDISIRTCYRRLAHAKRILRKELE